MNAATKSTLDLLFLCEKCTFFQYVHSKRMVLMDASLRKCFWTLSTCELKILITLWWSLSCFEKHLGNYFSVHFSEWCTLRYKKQQQQQQLNKYYHVRMKRSKNKNAIKKSTAELFYILTLNANRLKHDKYLQFSQSPFSWYHFNFEAIIRMHLFNTKKSNRLFCSCSSKYLLLHSVASAFIHSEKQVHRDVHNQ